MLIKISKIKKDLDVFNRIRFWSIVDYIDYGFFYRNTIGCDLKIQKFNSLGMRSNLFQFGV